MDDTTEAMDDVVAKQAMHDRSVIDHLVDTFGPLPAPSAPRPPVRERSPVNYHQIRKSWAAGK
jgi:hypothetical protein